MATNHQLPSSSVGVVKVMWAQRLIHLQTNPSSSQSYWSGSHTLGLGMRPHICLACCLPSLNSGTETSPPPRPHPDLPADRLQTVAERPTTSATRSFPPSNTLGFSSYSATLRSYSILQVGEGAWFASHVSEYKQ